MWHLPIKREHRVAITSQCADITNSSAGDRFGGASQAAAFLECFIHKDTKWAHIDIAGPSTAGNVGTGFCTQTILNYLIKESDKDQQEECSESPVENLRFSINRNKIYDLLI
jgi:leucyl aminopeptidase